MKAKYLVRYINVLGQVVEKKMSRETLNGLLKTVGNKVLGWRVVV